MRSVFLAIASIISAFAATLCCLPALVFLIFGSTFTLFGFTEQLSEFRGILSILALVCLTLSIFYFFKKDRSCSLKKTGKKWLLIYVFLAVFVFILLSYPEVLGAIYA
ncbi:aryl sulfotransferase [Campylobacter sp. MOP7]|uniref:aryl sulfotransferase n=1 Tax=Campylobacter canis TaxID=3378588 RepID=UPI00387EE16E